jgi:hypothetical protein
VYVLQLAQLSNCSTVYSDNISPKLNCLWDWGFMTQFRAGHTGARTDGARIPDECRTDPGWDFWGIAPASQWSWVESVLVFYERGEPSEVHCFRYSTTANP